MLERSLDSSSVEALLSDNPSENAVAAALSRSGRRCIGAAAAGAASAGPLAAVPSVRVAADAVALAAATAAAAEAAAVATVGIDVCRGT